MGLLSDIQRGGQIRMEYMGIALLIGLLLLPVLYVLLWKAAIDEQDGGAGWLGDLLKIPCSRAVARKKLIGLHIVLLIPVICYIVIACSR